MHSRSKRNILTVKESVPHRSTLMHLILSSLLRNCSLLEEKAFTIVLNSAESIRVYSLSERSKQFPIERREFYFTFSGEASKERIL